jgi:DNA-binding transcriptional LysR family regulator
MELTPLRYFRAIAAAGHMTRAARELGVTQPALSAMLRKLETELGAELFHRTGRGVELTDAGRLFLAFAEESLRAADSGRKAVRELIGLERGLIRVGGGATAIAYLLPPVISAVRRAHPGLRFYIREAGSVAVTQAVLTGELDLGIVTLPVNPGDAGRLVQGAAFEDELRLIVPPSHRLAGRKGFAWKELAGEAFVGFEAGSAVREVIDSAARAAGVMLEVVMELRSIGSIQSMVRAGVGIGFVSRFALGAGDGLGAGLASRDGSLTRRLALVRRKDREPGPAAAAFERALKGTPSRPGP